MKRSLGCYNRVSALPSVGDAGVLWPASIRVPCLHFGGAGIGPRVARASALGDDADRTHVARLTTPFNRGLSLAFPRAGTSVTRHPILSVLVTPIQSPCAGEDQQGPSNRRIEGADTTPQLTLEGASCGARRHRVPPDATGPNTPV